MTTPLNVLFNATAKNTQIVLTVPSVAVNLFSLPSVIIFAGAGRDRWFTPNQPVDSAILEVGSDGNYIGHVSPQGTLVKGTMTFNPSSPTVAALGSLANYQASSGILIGSTLTITNISVGTTVSYNNFLVTSNFIGWEFAQQLNDISFNFSCAIPNYVDLAPIVALAGNI